MLSARPEPALTFVRRIVDGDPVGDSALLAAYRDRGDEAAFAELVKRYGPMVFGVCRRQLARREDAEDAFQATFLYLARTSTPLDPDRPFAAWLYTVAYRSAVKTRHRRDRREEVERKAEPMPIATEPVDPFRSEWGNILDEEVNKLPERDREILLLCDLRGVSHQKAAADLNLPPGSISRRLLHARETLRARLSRRGVALGAAAVASTLGRAGTDVPPDLTRAVLRAVTGAASSEVAIDVSRSMLREAKLTRTLRKFAVLAAVAGAAGGAGWLALADTNRSDPTATVQPQPGVSEREELLRTAWLHDAPVRSVVFSPDGSRTATSSSDGTVRLWDTASGREIYRWQGPAAGAAAVAFTPDGRRLAVEAPEVGTFVWDTSTGERKSRLSSHTRTIVAAAYSDNGHYFASASDDRLVVFDITKPRTEREERNLEEEECVKVGEMHAGERRGTAAGVHALGFSADSQVLFYARWQDNQLTVFGASLLNRPGPKLKPPARAVRPPLSAMSFTAAGRRLVWSDGGGRVRLADLFAGTVDTLPTTHAATVVAIASGGDRILTADAAGEIQETVVAPDGSFSSKAFADRANGVTGLAISPDGSTLAVADSSRRLRRWNLSTGRELPPR